MFQTSVGHSNSPPFPPLPLPLGLPRALEIYYKLLSAIRAAYRKSAHRGAQLLSADMDLGFLLRMLRMWMRMRMCGFLTLPHSETSAADVAL